MSERIASAKTKAKEINEERKEKPNFSIGGTANISEILYAKLYFHLKKPKTCTLRIWLFC